MKAHDRAEVSLEGLQTLLDSARGLVDKLARDPLLPRVLTAFFRFPEADREPILRVLERDSTWRRIIEDTARSTGITVSPNPHASLYVHVFDEVTGQPVEPEPLPRDIEAIRLGIERFVPMLQLFFQEGVHEQWTRSARELIRGADADLRRIGVRLAEEVLAMIAQVESETEPPAG